MKEKREFKSMPPLRRTKRVMMALVLGCFITCTVWAQHAQVSMELKNVTVKEALEVLKKQTGYSVWFNSGEVALGKQVSVRAKDKSVEQVLEQILKGQDLSYTVNDERKHIHIIQKPKAGPTTVKGKVLDRKDNQPLIGCTISIKGKKTATITDLDGNYQITVEPGDVLLFSYVGYEPEEVPAASNKTALVYMSDDNVLLQDVVVTGYQTLKKYNVTGAVSTLDNEKISLRSSVGLEGILEGAIPGLTVYNKEYRIRGGASLNSGNKPLFIVDDFEVEELPDNMDVVENITVLKDAAATAIWGSRAANGVIVITTKKGRKDDFQVSYSNNFRISAKPDFDDLNRVTSEQLVDYDREVALKGYYDMMGFGYQGKGYSLSQEIIEEYLPGFGNTMSPENIAKMDARLNVLKQQSNRKQIEDYLLRNSFKQEHLVSLSGGKDKIKYYLSGSFVGGHSEYEGDEQKSFNVNSRTSYDVNKILTLRADLSATFEKNNNGYSGLQSDIYNLFPFQMLTDEQGTRVYNYDVISRAVSNEYKEKGFYEAGSNILEELDLANNFTHNTDYKVRLGADFRVWKGLNVSADYQYEKYVSNTKNIQSGKSGEVRRLVNDYTEEVSGGLKYNIPKGDILDHSRRDVDSWVFKLGATLNRHFGVNKEHYVNATAGFEMRSRHAFTERYRRLGYNDQLLTSSDINAVDLSSSWHYTPWGSTVRYDTSTYNSFSDILNRERSYYLSGVYTYDDRYTLSASMRIDESNLFGVDDKYRRNPIWAVGANWNVRNEKFFHCDAITALMVRASLGLTGNFDRSGSTAPVMIARFIPNNNIDGGGFMRLQNPPNPLLRWERTRSINTSVDLGLWNRLDLTLTYYRNNSYDLLGNAELDPTVGYKRAVVNSADMTNQGMELELNADIIRTKDFTWNIGFVYSYNRNKVTKNNVQDADPVYNRTHGVTHFVEGYARESLWSYRWAGLNDKGVPQAYKADGTKTTSIDDLEVEDIEYSGTYQPKHNGSFFTGFRYKGLQANFLFVYNYGHVFRVEYPDMNPYESSPTLNKLVGDRWRKPGDEAYTDIPCISSDSMEFLSTQTDVSNLATYSSNSIRCGNMVRLREILLSYELPSAWLKKTPISRLAITAQLNNVWLWTANKEGYDPEAVNPVNGSFSLTQPLSFTAGLKLNF